MSLFNKKENKIENLEDLTKRIEELELKIDKLFLEMEEMKKESESHIQKAKLIRYNPFDEMGGDQSFTLALLNKDNSGIIVTSIFNQEKSRVFGKEIIKGKSNYQLSAEEANIIDEIKRYGND